MPIRENQVIAHNGEFAVRFPVQRRVLDEVMNMAIQQQTDFPLPANLHQPVDDRAADDLVDMGVPQVSLLSTAGRIVDLSNLSATRTVRYC